MLGAFTYPLSFIGARPVALLTLLAASFATGVQAAAPQKYRVMAITNATSNPITFEWMWTNKQFSTKTLGPNQSTWWHKPWSRDTAAKLPKIAIRWHTDLRQTGDFDSAVPTKVLVLQGHVVKKPSLSIANHYEFHLVGKHTISVRRVP